MAQYLHLASNQQQGLSTPSRASSGSGSRRPIKFTLQRRGAGIPTTVLSTCSTSSTATSNDTSPCPPFFTLKMRSDKSILHHTTGSIHGDDPNDRTPLNRRNPDSDDPAIMTSSWDATPTAKNPSFSSSSTMKRFFVDDGPKMMTSASGAMMMNSDSNIKKHFLPTRHTTIRSTLKNTKGTYMHSIPTPAMNPDYQYYNQQQQEAITSSSTDFHKSNTNTTSACRLNIPHCTSSANIHSTNAADCTTSSTSVNTTPCTTNTTTTTTSANGKKAISMTMPKLPTSRKTAFSILQSTQCHNNRPGPLSLSSSLLPTSSMPTSFMNQFPDLNDDAFSDFFLANPNQILPFGRKKNKSMQRNMDGFFLADPNQVFGNNNENIHQPQHVRTSTFGTSSTSWKHIPFVDFTPIRSSSPLTSPQRRDQIAPDAMLSSCDSYSESMAYSPSIDFEDRHHNNDDNEDHTHEKKTNCSTTCTSMYSTPKKMMMDSKQDLPFEKRKRNHDDGHYDNERDMEGFREMDSSIAMMESTTRRPACYVTNTMQDVELLNDSIRSYSSLSLCNSSEVGWQHQCSSFHENGHDNTLTYDREKANANYLQQGYVKTFVMDKYKSHNEVHSCCPPPPDATTPDATMKYSTKSPSKDKNKEDSSSRSCLNLDAPSINQNAMVCNRCTTSATCTLAEETTYTKNLPGKVCVSEPPLCKKRRVSMDMEDITLTTDTTASTMTTWTQAPFYEPPKSFMTTTTKTNTTTHSTITKSPSTSVATMPGTTATSKHQLAPELYDASNLSGTDGTLLRYTHDELLKSCSNSLPPTSERIESTHITTPIVQAPTPVYGNKCILEQHIYKEYIQNAFESFSSHAPPMTDYYRGSKRVATDATFTPQSIMVNPNSCSPEKKKNQFEGPSNNHKGDCKKNDCQCYDNDDVFLQPEYFNTADIVPHNDYFVGSESILDPPKVHRRNHDDKELFPNT